MPEEDVSQRYIQALYSMSEREVAQVRVPMFKRDELGHCIDIDTDTLSPETLNKASRQKVAKKLRGLRNRAPLLIKEFPTGTLTIGQLNAYLDMLERQHNFIPDQLIVDSPDLMDVDSKNIRTDTGRNMKMLRGLGSQRNAKRGGMAVIALNQADSASASIRTVKLTNFSEDWSKMGTADIVLTGSQTEDEYKIGLARILAAKVRKQRKNVMALISQSYDVGQFCLDSTYMSARLTDEIKRMTGE